jgi:hypothetical protein
MAQFTDQLVSFGLSEYASQLILWTAIWHGLFWICLLIASVASPTYSRLDPPTQSYFAASMVSNIHAFYLLYLTTAAATSLDVLNSTRFLETSDESNFAIIVFMSYLISDLLLTVRYIGKWPGWVAYVIHHAVGIFMGYYLLFGQYGHFMAIGAMVTEGTTPFINQRWFMDKANKKDSTLYLINGVLITVIWFILRIGGFLWIGSRMWIMSPQIAQLSFKEQLIIPSSYIIGFALQIFWFSKILKGALKTIFAKPSSSQTKLA